MCKRECGNAYSDVAIVKRGDQVIGHVPESLERIYTYSDVGRWMAKEVRWLDYRTRMEDGWLRKFDG